MLLKFALVVLRSYFIFSRKRRKVFYEGSPETRGGGLACYLFLLEEQQYGGRFGASMFSLRAV